MDLIEDDQVDLKMVVKTREMLGPCEFEEVESDEAKTSSEALIPLSQGESR